MGDINKIQGGLIDSVYELLNQTPTNKKGLKERINEYCNKHTISENQLSEILGIQRSSLRRILEGDAQKVDIITIVKIGHLLSIDTKEVIKEYIADFSSDKIKDLERPRKIGFILENFDLQTLKKAGFINSVKDFDHIENRIVNFFGLESIFQYENMPAFSALYSKPKMSSEDKMQNFWLRCAISQFKQINNPHDYDPEALIDVFPNIRAYTMYEKEGFKKVVEALFNLGVTVIVQPYLSKSSVYGATFIINEKPCIVLTNLFDRYDTLWFTLIHELHHALNDFDHLKKANYHISNPEKPDVFLMEEKANLFAREFLFGEEKLKFAKSFIFRADKVKQYAKSNEVHPSIIYGQYLRDITENFKQLSDKEYPKYRRYLISSKEAVKELAFNPYKEETIEKISKILNDKVYNKA